MTATRPSRRRIPLALAGVAIVAAGLASRAFPSLVPATLGKYPGDALWAWLVLVGIAFVRPTIGSARLAALTLAIAWLVEFSQLYRAPWIDSIRATRVGHWVLGSGFHAADLLAYAVGVLIGTVFDRWVFQRETTTDGHE